MVQVTVFSMVVLILIIHTILSHLLNWMFRSILKDKSLPSDSIIIIGLVVIFELLAVLLSIDYYIN